MKCKFILSALLLAFASQTAFAAGGVVLGTTRVVFDAKNKEAALTVTNKTEGQYFLIQSWVDDQNGNKKVPFTITPPLFRLDAGKENMLRIIKTPGDVPADRESVYWINVKSIPPAPADGTSSNVLQLAIKTKIKLFYRPTTLQGKVEDAPASLQWSHKGKELIVKNSSEYAVTLNTVTIAGKDIADVNMILPKQEVKYEVPFGTENSKDIVFTTITDFGGITKPITASIN
ncbi:fimbrial biogenesis chaperone [Rahnella selenatireducens]|uniref:fimbrial biogenesis chaperone n=1 Tax=Rahnella selenatireducens TaxID=3389797 RepID=UPI00396837A7